MTNRPNHSLAELFIQRRGQPVEFNGHIVVLMDRIPIRAGSVRLEFLGEKATSDRGIAFKSDKGWIELSSGKRVSLLHTWDEPGLPRTVEHRVNCRDGELRVWNIYRTKHTSGLISVDAWTGNAGMIVNPLTENSREYACSSGPGGFDPSELLVRISWNEMQAVR